jgi:hypothetical protein
VGLLLAVAAGALATAMVERSDRSIRSADRIRALTGAPVLAAPLAQAGTVRFSASEDAAVRAVLGAGVVVTSPGLTGAEGASVDPRGAAQTHMEPIALLGYGEAAAAAGQGHGVILAVRVGRTLEAEVMSACALLRDAGATLAGTIAVCGSTEEARDLWG